MRTLMHRQHFHQCRTMMIDALKALGLHPGQIGDVFMTLDSVLTPEQHARLKQEDRPISVEEEEAVVCYCCSCS